MTEKKVETGHTRTEIALPVRLDGKGFRVDTRNGGEFIPLYDAKGRWLADLRDYGDVHEQIVTAVNQRAAVLEASGALLKKLDEIAEATKGIFAEMSVRGRAYTGPNWEAEANTLRALLQPSQEEEGKR